MQIQKDTTALPPHFYPPWTLFSKKNPLNVLFLTLIMLACSFSAADAQSRRDIVDEDVMRAVRNGEEVSVIISLEEPSSLQADRFDLTSLRQEVRGSQEAVLAQVTDADFRLRHQFKATPALSGVILTQEGLNKLLRSGGIIQIIKDEPGQGGLAESVGLIGANTFHDDDIKGDGVVVGVLDSGFDSDHPDLQDALVAEACFISFSDGSGACPNGESTQIGPGAAEDDHRHGTHVTGIITSNGVEASVGVAPNAEIVAVKVLDTNNNFSSTSEVLAGLDYILDNPQLGVQVINMSLGTGRKYAGDCDDANVAFTTTVNTLRANGVTTFASAGNTNETGVMGLPACISSVISVGNSTKDDEMWVSERSGSTRSETTDIFAPGVGIVSSNVGGGTISLTGTSMASPTAAGCAALLIQSGEATTPDAIEARLETSDVIITDPVTGLEYPRIDCTNPNANMPPVASFVLFPPTGLTADFTDTSSDADGTVVSWAWDFGDGNTSTDQNPSHTYDAAGTYPVTLVVTDDDGAESEPFTLEVTVEGDNAPPVASFVLFPPTGLTADFTDTSSDADGTVVSWAWDFGDGNTSTDQNPSHTYDAAGTYPVTLVVTDDDGAESEPFTLEVTVEGDNAPPVASFVLFPPTGMTVEFTDASTDSDGTIVSWAWDFGDGNTSTDQNPSHTYDAAGTYPVTLVVTDDDGAESEPFTLEVTIEGDNAPPVADFTFTIDGLTVQFTDASTDSDGTVVEWGWSMGDPNGTILSDQNPTFTYPEAGTYTVVLAIVDNDGAPGNVIKEVTVGEVDMPDNAVTTFILVDADENEDLFELTDGITLDLSVLPHNLNVRAVVTDGVESVELMLNPQGVSRVENVAPYALFGDDTANEDYFAGTFDLGEQMLSATPYSGDNREGEEGMPLSIKINVIDGGSAGIAVTKFVLVDAHDNEDIMDLTDGITLDLAMLPNELNVRAVVTDGVESVELMLNPQGVSRVENAAPYALFGDDTANDDYFSGTFANGEQTLSATPYTEDQREGEKGASLSIKLTIENGSHAPDVASAANGTAAAGKGALAADEPETIAAEIPTEFALGNAYPNPFNPETTISFSLPEAVHVQLVVYDILGQHVATLVDGSYSAGKHEVRFQASNLPSGTYLYRLVLPGQSFTGKMLLLK